MCLDDSNEFRALPKAAKKSKDGFTLWDPVDAHYVTAQDVRAAMIAQSKATKNGVVAEFRLPTLTHEEYAKVYASEQHAPDPSENEGDMG